ncbi:MAG: N-acetylmuramoyl-L-alanine amidase [Patescibacteria group bacterium]|jgi:N-acetylmuramoyl-L-alanine amidase
MKVNRFKFFIFLFLVIVFVFLFFGFSKNEQSQATSWGQLILNVKKEPTRIGIQAGHWKNGELPDELYKLRLYGGGTTVGKVTEWKTNLEIAQKIEKILKENNYAVDLLPATVPPDYKADAFVSIHCDGNDVSSVTGYKSGASAFDQSGKAKNLSQMIADEYSKATGLRKDPNVTEDMTEYYVFNFEKYEHSIDPKTPAALLEMGFLTNTNDRNLLLNKQDQLAKSIAQGIINFLNSK